MQQGVGRQPWVAEGIIEKSLHTPEYQHPSQEMVAGERTFGAPKLRLRLLVLPFVLFDLTFKFPDMSKVIVLRR